MVSGGRISESVALLDGEPYALVSEEALKQVSGVTRRWDVKRVPRQAGDPEQEFEIPLTSFDTGAGVSYAVLPEAYESANGWDLSTQGKAITWPRLATGAPLVTDNIRSWEYYDFAANFYYLMRGGWAAKYEPDPTPGAVWPILEYHYFGDDRVVAGKWAEFNGAVYVPLINPDDDTEQRFQQLIVSAAPSTEIQLLTETGSPGSGTFTLTFNDGTTSTTTAALAYNISAANLQIALRLIKGLARVTVARSGSSTNFIWTVTMTAAPSAMGTTSPPALAVNNTSMPGGTAVADSTSVAGVGDKWTLGPADIVSRYFAAWEKPGVGPTLALCYENFERLNGDDPMSSGDWGAAYAVDNSTYRINALAVWNRYLMAGKQNGLYSTDEQAVSVLETKDLAGVIDNANFVGMTESQGFLLCPHKNGLLRWSPGSYSFVGAEQDGLFEGQIGLGWGCTVGITPTGRTTYTTVTDAYNGLGVINSFQPPVAQLIIDPRKYKRGPLTPYMNHHFSGSAEDIIASTLQQSPQRTGSVVSGADLASVGTIAWTNPNNISIAAADAVAVGPGTTHYLKALLDADQRVPDDAVITGVQVNTPRYVQTASVTKSYTGALQTFVVPTGVTSLHIDAQGAQGTANGARVETDIAVTPGETLNIYVGGQAGFNGGGAVGANGTGGHSGGGATDIRRGGTAYSDRFVVAGGGGGVGSTGASGGAGAGGAGGAGSGGGGPNSSTAIPGTAGAPGGGAGGAAGTGVTAAGPPNANGNGSAGSAGTTLGGYPSGGGGGGGGGGSPGGVGGGGGGHGIDDGSDPPDTTGAGGGGGGSGGGSVSSGTFTTLTPSYRAGNGQCIISYSAIVDSSVCLVVGGAVSGNNLADTTSQWPLERTTKVYGGPMETWGLSLTGVDVNAATFGFVVSAAIITGGAILSGIASMVIYYTSSNGSPGSLLIVVQVAADGVTATPYAYALPRAGMPVANDADINHAASNVSFASSRQIAPSRNTQKTYRATEFYAGMDPEVNTPGFQMWAAVDNGTPFALLDSDGAALTCLASGDYEAFFPDTAAAIGRWVQLIPTVPALSGGQVAVEVDLRDIVLHGSWAPKMTDYVTAVFELRDNAVLSDGTVVRATAQAQREALMALCGPRPVGSAPIALHDPETGENTTCMMTGVPKFQRINFQNASAPSWVAIVTLRKTPRSA